MLTAVNNGHGRMAQFNCRELGGSGQWMQGGMNMVGDMFNYGLKNTVNNLCTELSNALANTQMLSVVPVGSTNSNQWWPSNLGNPFSSGAQNNIRYAMNKINNSYTDQSSTDCIIRLIEKIAKLHEAGTLTDEEFNTKKSELLCRI
jgi:hypothetical protein